MEAYTEKQFWRTIESMDWVKDYDDERIGKELAKGEYGNKEYLTDLFRFVYRKFNEIDKKWGDKIRNVSDDSYSDLTYHVIGLGEAEYYENLESFKTFQDRANNMSYQESFLYCFHHVNYVYDVYKEEEFNKGK